MSSVDGRNDCTVHVDPTALSDAGPNPDLIGSIDQGTSSTRFVVFTRKGRIAASAQVEHRQIYPGGEDRVGWHEHDPIELWTNVSRCVEAVTFELRTAGGGLDLSVAPLKAVGITNQRETTLAWNAFTGRPYHNAIVWDDLRTSTVAADLAGGDADRLRGRTGLPLASYFAGTKVRWMLDNVEELRDDLNDPEERDNVRFGTVDTWLAYQLTGYKSDHPGAANVGGAFVTDVSNASRWLFMDVNEVRWDPGLISEVCGPYDVPLSALPTIGPSSGRLGLCSASCGIPSLSDVPVGSILGDQQSALFGQTCFRAGEAKNTYGTGMFLMMNTGGEAVPSRHGLLTTVAYQLGEGGEVAYALEGSVSHSGSTIQWLRDQLGIISTASESETLARQTSSNDGLYLVPAFAGLFAPRWRPDARACIVGVTTTHTKCHVARAALEAAAYQSREVFDSMRADSGVDLRELRVDGGGTANGLLMQFQADVLGRDVVRPVVMETTALGAAYAAGLAVGVWDGVDEIREMWGEDRRYRPAMAEEERERYWRGWNRAVERSLGWATADEEGVTAEDDDDGGGFGVHLRAAGAVLRRHAAAGMVAAAALAAGFALGRVRR